MTLSFSESEESIVEFAGLDLEDAKYYEEDDEFLFGFESKTTHCQVVVKP